VGRRAGGLLHPVPPYTKNDQATIESKNNTWYASTVSTTATTPARNAPRNRLWRLVNDRFNYLTPTKKPVRFGTDRNGRRTRLYDKPATPLDRLLAAKVISPDQEADLVAYRDSLNPAQIAREIADLQAVLLKLAKDKTEQLYLASIPTALPDNRKGTRIKAS
jgi:hypothetical protein